MFYSQFILAKKGPLGTIWIAAHLERKLRKNQVADTDIGVSVDSIMFPEAPIALRLSSHLLLGVVRIYNRKVNYLFDDCSEALLNVKQAFRSTAVDLPPEESKAPYHSITLPENFDLDDFELPDSDIYKGNYVDHHISSRDQITLQDSMEGVSYSTSKFGLDERFGDGDGDASGLDLDEELLMNKIDTAGVADERSSSPLKQNEHPEDLATNSENMDGAGADQPADVMDYAQAPSTPGLVEEPNLSNAKNASTCDDHMESEYHLMESTVRDNNINVPYEDKQEVDWCSQDDTISNATHLPQGQREEKDHLSGLVEIKESEPQGGSPEKGQDGDTRPTSEFTERTEASDVPLQEDFPTEDVKEDKSHFLSVDETSNQGSVEVVQEKSAFETSGVEMANTDPQVSKVQQKSYDVDGSEIALGNQVEFFLESPESQAHDKEVANVTTDSGLCNSVVVNPDVVRSVDCTETDGDAKSCTAVLETNESRDTIDPGKDCIISDPDQILKENLVQELPLGEDILVAIDEADAQVHRATSQDMLVKNLNNIKESEFPAPEKLLSVPEGLIDSRRDILVEVSPSEFEGVDVIGDAGRKSAVGKKRSFTESTLTEQSLNSVESSRQVRFKRTTGSVPDDDDLLSSILVGRNSSVLKLKPTPPLTEVTSIKRTRALARPGAPKRKVLVDDTMVLHGDMIRHQLTNTEDIRRIRKKAPCTLSEISMIQKQHMEDDIFHGTIFTGMAVELAYLHSQTYDLSRISVSKDDVNLPSLETVIESNLASTTSIQTATEARLSSQDDKNDASLETIVVPYSAPMDDNYVSSLVTMSASHLTSPYNEEPGENNVPKTNEQVGPNFENPLPFENNQGEANFASIYADFSQEEQIKPTDHVGPNDFTQEPLVSAAEVETSLINAVTENPCVMSEVEPLGLLQTDSINEFSERISEVNMDASAPDQMVSIHLDELDFYADIDGRPAIDRSEVAEKDAQNEVVAKDVMLPDMVHDAAVDNNHGEMWHNLENEICNISTLEEVGTSPEALIREMEDGFVDNAENFYQSEAYQPNITDAGIPGFELHDYDDISYSAAENDTGFLNVDDDELTEIDGDHMPDDEDIQCTDNSGWSSRTRAVSKYLQTAFVKERECGNKSLSMDNLLAGKSRKEASRMFFETLVLKTRDYIHVEQPNPYDEITLKPRPSLMKSDF